MYYELSHDSEYKIKYIRRETQKSFGLSCYYCISFADSFPTLLKNLFIKKSPWLLRKEYSLEGRSIYVEYIIHYFHYSYWTVAPKKVREVTAEATWNALIVSWKAPVNHALQYHLTFQCTVKGEKSPVVKTSIDKKMTSYTFSDLTDTRDVAACEVSIVPENFVGVGPETKGIFKTSPLGKQHYL